MFKPATLSKPAKPIDPDHLKIAAMFVVGVLLVGNAYLVTMGKMDLGWIKAELFESKPMRAILPQVEANYVPPTFSTSP